MSPFQQGFQTQSFMNSEGWCVTVLKSPVVSLSWKSKDCEIREQGHPPTTSEPGNLAYCFGHVEPRSSAACFG